MKILCRVSALALAAYSLGACSTVMEANRPDPVDLTKYSVGEGRVDVISHLGAPTSSVHDGDNSCDVYKLYTKGISKVGKGAIILGEAAADFFTLGLAEVVATPGEAVSKNKLHTVLICYSNEGRLVSLTDEGQRVLATSTMTPSPAEIPSSSKPVAQ